MSREQQELMAFWKYDTFPYCLAGTIIKFGENGKVETKEYGINNWFKPFLIIKKEEGKKIIDNLMILRSELHNENVNIKDKYKMRAKKILDVPGAP